MDLAAEMTLSIVYSALQGKVCHVFCYSAALLCCCALDQDSFHSWCVVASGVNAAQPWKLIWINAKGHFPSPSTIACIVHTVKCSRVYMNVYGNIEAGTAKYCIAVKWS